jgi:hypothetical protein
MSEGVAAASVVVSVNAIQPKLQEHIRANRVVTSFVLGSLAKVY